MANRSNLYRSYVRQNYSEVIDGLALDDMQRRFLLTRWLDGYLWYQSKATRAGSRFYALRVLLLVGGAVTTAFASLTVTGDPAPAVFWLIFGLSLTTTVAAGLLELFKYGDEMKSARSTADRLEAEAWQFFTLSGPYAGFNHAGAYPVFVMRSEELRAAAAESRDMRVAAVVAASDRAGVKGRRKVRRFRASESAPLAGWG